MRDSITDIGAIKHPPPRQPAPRAYGDIGLLVAWWFVIACCLTAFDLVSSRAAYVPLNSSVVDHAWEAMLCAGVIGALYTERNRLLWGLVSAVGGLFALVVMAVLFALVGMLLAA